MTVGVHNPVGSVSVNGAALTTKKFDLESTLELPADHYSILGLDSSTFRNASIIDTASVSAGLRDAAGATTVTIAALTNGPIDEYEMTVTPTSVVQTLRGRDAAARVLDRYFVDPNDPNNLNSKNLFARSTQIFPGATTEVMINTAGGPVVNPLNIGHHFASTVAGIVVASVGLKLSWEVRDYELLVERFIASGRVIDILRRLSAPWNQADPFKVDIFVQNDTVIVRHRSPLIPLSTANYTFDLTALRRSTLTIRKRRLRKIGRVHLQGGVAGMVSRTGRLGGGGVTSGGTTTVTLENTSFDKAGNVTSKTTTEETFRVPDRILLQSVKSTYTGGVGAPLRLTIRETIVNDWDASLYDANGNAVNAPKQNGQLILREGIDPSDDAAVFRQLGDEDTQYEYDDLGFMQHQTTTTRKVDLSASVPQLQYDKMTSKLLHDIGPLWIEEVTEQYSFDTSAQRWNLTQRDSAISSGHRAGGPGRGTSRAGVSSGQVQNPNVFINQVISTDADAVPVSFSDQNLSFADLQFIFGMLQAASGAVEFELQFQGVGMAWMQRGQTIRFFDIRDEHGIEIVLPIVTVTEVKTTYDESRSDAQYLMSCRAFGWITPLPTGTGAQSTPFALVTPIS